MIAIDSIKQPALDADLKAIQQINLTGNLDKVGETTIFSFLRGKENILPFFTRNCQSIVILFRFNIISI